MTIVGQMLVIGILLGVIYTLIGVGMTLTLGVLRIVNLAHGVVVVLGSFVAFDLFSAWGVDPVISVFLAIPLFFVIGVIVERLLVRRAAAASPERAMLVLFGLMIVMIAVATMAWTSDSRSIAVGYANGSVTFAGIIVPEAYLIMVAVAIVVLVLVELLLYKTMLGKALRAVGQSRDAAEILGINSARMATIVFGIGTGTAAAAGVALSVLFPFSVQMEGQWLAYAFIVVLVGGLGGVRSSLVGGMVLGIGQSLFSQLFSLSVVPVILYGLLAVALIVRGGGLGVVRGRQI